MAVLGLGLLSFFGSEAEATSLTGDFAITVQLRWTDLIGPSWAPGWNFVEKSGTFLFLGGSGDFAALGPTGTTRDFSYTGPHRFNVPGPPIFSFEFPGGLTFDLLEIAGFVVDSSAGMQTVSGTGIFHKDGFDDTVGLFNFSGPNVWGLQGTISLSTPSTPSTPAVAVPEPSTIVLVGSMILLGSGVLGLSVIAWKRGRFKKAPPASA